MAKKLNAVEAAIHERIRVLMKLQRNSIKSEKDLQGMKTETMLDLPGITVPEMRIIIEIQKSVRDGRFFSYLLEAPEILIPDCVKSAARDESLPGLTDEEGGEQYA